MRSCTLLVALVAATGCTAAFRSQDGGAIAPTGVSSGRTNSIYIGDRGGLLTRAGLLGLGALAAAGATHTETTTTVSDEGSYYLVTKESTTTVDPVAAQNAADIMNAAADPSQNFGGLCAGLEIAARDLGGDTSGWMFDFGYATAATSKTSRWGLRGSAKLAFGEMTMHDRTLTAYIPDSVQTMKGDASYGFFGTFLRMGATYWLPVSRHNVAMLEGFLETDLNLLTALDVSQSNNFDELSHPSPWSVGVRFTAIKVLYVEGKVLWSAMNSEHTSMGLEAGFAF
jgi:hypothetical protein